MKHADVSWLQCQVVEEDVEMSLDELCRACDASGDLVLQLADLGVLDVRRVDGGWLFVGASLRRTRIALRLMRDLDVNTPGAALVVELLEEIARLRDAVRQPTAPHLPTR